MSRFVRLSARVAGAALALWMLVPTAGVFAQDAVVDMQGIQFVPQEIHVAPGATLQWTNSSPLVHTVTADDGSFDSGPVNGGDTFTMTFDTPGTFTYFCQPHKAAGMVGTVIVDDPSASIAAPGAASLPPRDPNPTDYEPDH